MALSRSVGDAPSYLAAATFSGSLHSTVRVPTELAEFVRTTNESGPSQRSARVTGSSMGADAHMVQTSSGGASSAPGVVVATIDAERSDSRCAADHLPIKGPCTRAQHDC
jgi:hypothetical protein